MDCGELLDQIVEGRKQKAVAEGSRQKAVSEFCMVC